MNPKYVHDCGKCEFHGQIIDPLSKDEYDIWSCFRKNDHSQTAIILRYGSEGNEYKCFGLDTAIRVSKIAPEYKLALDLIGDNF